MDMETGRPNAYSEELAEKICKLLSASDKGLEDVCAECGTNSSSVYRYLNQHESFREKYARAREQQADFLADQIIKIADDSSQDVITKTIGHGEDAETIEVENREFVNRSKLRVDARKWKASKLAPKKYGDRLELDNKHSGKVEITPITGMKIE